MKRALALALGCAGLLLSGPAVAQDDDDWEDEDEGEIELDRGRSSLYVSVRGLHAIDNFTGDTFQNGGRSFDRTRIQDSQGVDGRIGYRLGPIVALEAEVEWIKGFDLNETIAGDANYQASRLTSDFDDIVLAGGQIGKTRTAKWTGFTNTINAKIYVPLGAFQPYVVAGGGFMYMNMKVQSPFERNTGLKHRHDTGLAARAGAGFELYGFEDDSVAIVAEAAYVAGFGNVEDYRYLSTTWGLLFRW